MASTTARLTQYRARLRMAAGTVLAVRIAAASAAVGVASFVLVAWILGPMTPLVWLCIGWAVIFGMIASAVTWSLRPLLKLKGHGALGLVGAQQPSLLSPLQSAYELQTETAFSRELIVAQRVGVLRSLERSPARKFIPWRWLLQPAFAAALLVGVAAWWSLGFDRAAAGRYALLHVEQSGAEGVLTSHVVARTDAHLVFPTYMKRPDKHVEEADHLVVPRGTAIEYGITPIGDAARVILELPGRHVQAERVGARFIASFVADIEGPVEIYVESTAGERRVDHRARSITVQHDQPPQARLIEPREDLVAEPRQPIVLRHAAVDDHGIYELTLIFKLPNGEHLRRPLFGPAEETQLQVEGETTVRLEEFSLAPADAVMVWVEAKDGNRIDGPGLTQSEARTLTLASDITRRRERIVELEQLLDSLLLALAVRLERPVPRDLPSARQRLVVATNAHRHTLGLLADVGEHPGPRTIPLLLDMRKRLERLTKAEAAAYRAAVSYGARARRDVKLVKELETDTLLVADLISQARLNDAAEIAREMQQLRREIASLVAELRRGSTPELQKALMAALDRAERRMRALHQQLAQAMRYVPGEFVNAQSGQATKSTNALQSLREALAEGDLDAAEDALARLDQTIDAMVRGLAASEETLVEGRFGPREKALMEAMDAIRDLEVEQQRAANESRRMGNKAARRAAGGANPLDSETQEALQGQAEEVAQQMDGLSEDALGPYERSMRRRAQERLADYQQALRGGDLGEALSMANKAADAARSLAKDLELSALMFRGRGGQTSEAAAAARRAAADALDLRDATEKALPDIRDALTERDHEQLERHIGEQDDIQQAAHQLARRLREEVGGVPVSEQAAADLESIERPMQRATKALQESQPLEAHKQQQAAADQLRRLRQNLESLQRSTGKSDGESGQAGAQASERVEIPKGRTKADEMAWRRRVLDARKGDAPEGYQPAVQDYYERLLR